jgi:(2Fe-2S) ferredoxin
MNTKPLASVTEKLGIPQTKKHIFMCVRAPEQTCCASETAGAAWDTLKTRLKQLGLSEKGGIQRSKVECLRVCLSGPVAVVYPAGTWYSFVDNTDIDEIVESHLKRGQVVQRLLTPPEVGR